MANMFEMMKQATQMRKEMKRLQGEMEKQTAEYANGGITVTARGDMTIQSIQIDPEALRDAKVDKLERLFLQVVNGALKQVKKQTQTQMAAMAKSSGLDGLLGGS